jgi:branched-chain amino acid transport system substrate-binding protein
VRFDLSVGGWLIRSIRRIESEKHPTFLPRRFEDMAKKKSLLWIFLIFIFWFGIFSWSKAEAKGEVEEKLKEAHQSYSQKNYSRSKEILTYLEESFPNDPYFSYFEFMIAKCEYHLKNYQFAYHRFEDFIKTFPKSKFIPACYFMLGNINYLWGKKFESAQNFILAYQKAEQEELKRLAEKSMEPLLNKRLSERELEQLAQQNKDKAFAPKIFFWLGKRRFESKDYPKAKEALSYYQDNFPHGTEIKEVSLLLKELSSPTSQIVKVGVLTPLTGNYSNYGESMVRGIKLALLYSFMENSVELAIKDTKGDPKRAANLAKELIESEDVASIIGPLTSESTLEAGMVAGGARIPLISPTASQEGTGSLSEFIFQLSPSNQTKGKSLADFVIKEKKLSDFVMFVSYEQEDQEFALSFQEEAQKMGAKIMASEYLSEETEDFIPLLRKIKSILLERPPFDYGSKTDEFFINEIPVKLDGFLIVAGKDQILKILPQISFLKINTKIIGTEGCGSGEVLNLAQNLNQELIFTSDAYHLEDDQAWRSFSALYYKEHNQEPDRVAALGFDAMNLLISILEKRIFSPERIKESLLEIKNFEGVLGGIGFDLYGENKNIPIFEYQAGKVERLR